MTLRLHFSYAGEAHFLFETISYFIGFRIYLRLRKRRGDVVTDEHRWGLIAAALVGAAVGSKVLNWFVDPQILSRNWSNPYFLMGGKTVAGGLIGGLFAGDMYSITPGFLAQNHIELALGRDIGDVDERRFENVAILGAEAAKTLFPTQDPLGRSITSETWDRPRAFVVVGITDFAQDALGELVHIELPEVGTKFDAGDAVAEVESVKAVAEVYTPVAGTIVAVNTDLDGDEETVNKDPYGAGWLFKLKASDTGPLGKLLDASAYQTKIATHATSARAGGSFPVRRFIRMIPASPRPSASSVPALTSRYTGRTRAGSRSCV